MNTKSTLQDIIRVTGSNFVVLFSSVLVGFLLPKIIGVEDYGHYKTYTLYASYIGLLHFGIPDGIYLLYGGKDYETLDKFSFQRYSKTYMLIELMVSLVLVLVSFTVFSSDSRFIFGMLSIYLFFRNITNYFQIISQATCRISELSKRNILQSLAISIFIVMLWGLHFFAKIDVTYRYYLITYTFVIVILAVWYIYTYKNISFDIKKRVQLDLQGIVALAKVGFPLTLANLCSSLILTLDRQFVNVLFATEVYAIYAFAYNMLSLVTMATSAIATVIYPNLKKINKEKLRESYFKLISLIIALVYGCLLAYFPLYLFVNWALPNYSSSLPIFRIIFPGLAISSAVTIVMHNYYKAIGINQRFFIKSIITIAISGIANYVAYVFWGTAEAISIASIITMIFWYLYVEKTLIDRYKISCWKNFIYLLLMMILFYVITEINQIFLSGCIYLVVYLVVTILFYKGEIKPLLLRFEKKS